MSQLTDWDIALGFNDDKVVKGLDRLEKKFKKYEKALSSFAKHEGTKRAKVTSEIDKAHVKALRAQRSEEFKQIKARRKAIADDEKARIKSAERVAAAEAKGARKVRSSGGGGRAPSSPLQRQTAAGIRTRDAGIDRAVRSAGRSGTLLKQDGSSGSLAIAKQLESQVVRLRGVQRQLNQVVSKASPEYDRLSRQLVKVKASMADTNRAAAKQVKSFNSAKFAANGLRDSMRNMARSYLSVFAIMGVGNSVFQTAKEFDRLKAVMLLSASSAEEAGENFEFTRVLSNRLGADITSTTDAFAGFHVAATAGGLTADESKGIFTKLATSIQATGLNARQSGLAFLAFKQMISGPVIQAQEMNQVVEQMPQFLGLAKIALKEMGHEGDNFKDIIATGTVNSVKFVKTVSRLAHEQAVSTGAAEASQNSLVASQNRMTTALKTMADVISKSGLKVILSDIFDGVRRLAEGMTPMFAVTITGIKHLVGAIRTGLEHVDDFLSALGFDQGLGSILAGIVAIFTVGAIFKGLATLMSMFKNLTGVLRTLGIVSATTKGILGGPLGVAAVIAGGAAAGLGAQALFNRMDSGRSTNNSSTNTDNRTVVNNNTFHNITDAQDVQRTLSDQISWET